MNLNSARSLVAWLWSAHPAIVYALASQQGRQLGQDFSSDLDMLPVSFDDSGSDLMPSDISYGTSDPGISLSPVSLDSSALDAPDLSSAFDSGGLPGSSLDSSPFQIQTLSESDLAPVNIDLGDGGGAIAAGSSGDTGMFQAVGVDAATGAMPDDFNIPATSVANTTSQTASGLAGVAQFLTSSSGLSSLAKVASSYFQASAAQSNAQAAQARVQAAVVNAQTARAVTGSSALPVSYVTNGATGASVPVIATNSGYVPLTSSILSGLTPSAIETFFAQYGTALLIGGSALFLLYAASRRH
jgi:hypothetical protein